MRARVEEIFHEVADLCPEDRSLYFEEHGIEAEIRMEVTALLKFDSDTFATLDRNIMQVARHALTPLPLKGVMCGPYRLETLLGSGGMGSVYLAERADGEVSQRVAVKLLRPGSDSSLFRERFLAERQILAGLSHPNIAKLLDAGHLGEGQPYLVMEYIEGTPIDVFAADLNIRSKISLFLKVCAAVAYLHRNLVVHRDLKPANILVTAEGEPKLLDFGIAKIIDFISDSAATSVLMLTPDYASPEQVVGRPATTATDVYSLGAVLYKLLTGISPHRFEGKSAQAIVATVTSGRVTPPSVLFPAVKGDLEIILLKALRTEPKERYTTVERFAEDLESYLESRPIQARKGDALYRVSKFLRRRWLPVTAISLATAALLGGAFVANRERTIAQERFTQVHQLAARFVELHDDVANLPGSTKIREKMVTTALQYLDNLSRNTTNDSRLLGEIGQIYEKVADAQDGPGQPNLGRADDALRSYGKAIEFASRAAALDPKYRLDLAHFHTELAYLAMLNGHFPQARQSLDAASSLLDRLRTENPGDVELLALAARVALTNGDLSGAENNWKDQLAFFQTAERLQYEYLRLRPSSATRVRAYRISLLVSLALTGNKRYEEALARIRERTPLIDSLLATEPANPSYLRLSMEAANYEGQNYDYEFGNCLGKPVEAAAAFRRYLEKAHKLVAADPDNASARLSLAVASFNLSWPVGKIDPPQAIPLAKDAVRLLDEDLARNPHDRLLRSNSGQALRHLAYAYYRNHNIGEARTAIKQSIATEEQLVAESPADKHEQDSLIASRKVLAGF